MDPVLLAVTWAIESNFNLHPENNRNRDGTVDVGPMQIHYATWSQAETYLVGSPFGTNLAPRALFNGDPLDNLLTGATSSWTWSNALAIERPVIIGPAMEAGAEVPPALRRDARARGISTV